jgi:hypothetical protein
MAKIAFLGTGLLAARLPRLLQNVATASRYGIADKAQAWPDSA